MIKLLVGLWPLAAESYAVQTACSKLIGAIYGRNDQLRQGGGMGASFPRAALALRRGLRGRERARTRRRSGQLCATPGQPALCLARICAHGLTRRDHRGPGGRCHPEASRKLPKPELGANPHSGRPNSLASGINAA